MSEHHTENRDNALSTLTLERVFEAFQSGVIKEADLLPNVMLYLDYSSRQADYRPPATLDATCERNSLLREVGTPIVEAFLESQADLLSEAVPDKEPVAA